MERLILPLMMYKESGSSRNGTKKAHSVVPTWNHLYQIRQSKKFLDTWALRHKEKIEILARQWMIDNDWETTINTKVFVDVWIYWSDARERDCHNIDKIIMDAFEDAGIYDNDCNALVRYQDFDIDLDNPRIEIELSLGKKFDRKERVKELKKIKKEEEKRRK